MLFLIEFISKINSNYGNPYSYVGFLNGEIIICGCEGKKGKTTLTFG